MLYQIFYPLRESFFGFNIFRYITFRTAGAVATALILVFMFAPNIIEKLKKLKKNKKSTCFIQRFMV